MTRKGPLLTLVGGGVLAVVLLVGSIIAAAGDGAGDDLAAAAATPTPAPTGTPTEPVPPAEQVEEEPDPVTYVGYVDGGGASVAIIINGEEATAYVCDGASVEAWLTGPARNGELILSGDDGELVGVYDDDAAAGEATADGRSWTFTIDEVEPPEGLYRFADTVVGGAEVDGGWIVLPNGEQVGVLNVDGEPRPAPAIDPVTGEVTVAGTTVTAVRVVGGLPR